MQVHIISEACFLALDTLGILRAFASPSFNREVILRNGGVRYFSVVETSRDV